jgi:hypothetical protein
MTGPAVPHFEVEGIIYETGEVVYRCECGVPCAGLGAMIEHAHRHTWRPDQQTADDG